MWPVASNCGDNRAFGSVSGAASIRTARALHAQTQTFRHARALAAYPALPCCDRFIRRPKQSEEKSDCRPPAYRRNSCSSFSYFQRFPFDKIKIDRSFVQDLGEGKSSLAILRAVARLAESLGITVTVEGVETQEQLDRVRIEGIQQVQGYLVSAPRPIRELGELIATPGARRAAG